jgi:hypothetical protein
MLREEDFRFDRGRASHGGDFVRLTHVPTGVSRSHPGPLWKFDQHTLVQTWLDEIEAELRSKGLSQYIVPVYRTKNTPQRRGGG